MMTWAEEHFVSAGITLVSRSGEPSIRHGNLIFHRRGRSVRHQGGEVRHRPTYVPRESILRCREWWSKTGEAERFIGVSFAVL